MALFLTVGLGLVVWLLLSYTYPYPKLKWFSRIHTPESVSHRSSVITPSIAAFIQETMALENITGLSVAVVPKLGEPEFRTWGYRTEDGDEMTPDTLFYIGSLSKAFCVTAMGLLIDDFESGRNVTALPSGLTEFTWRTRLKDLLPDWQLMDEWASERANLHDILSHVSGIPRHDFSYGPEDTPLDALKALKYFKPTFELREQFSYNNIMFMIAAHVVATYAGQSYTSFVEERIFLPLGMTSSTFSPAKAAASHRLSQGWTVQGRRLPEWFTEDMAFLIAGPGGIISSAIDMSKWISAWLGEGVYEDQVVIPLSVYQNASSAYTVAVGRPTNPDGSIVGYGMGWGRCSYRGHDVVTHTGGLPGYSTALVFLPNDGIGISVFANGFDQSMTLQTILNRILDTALDLPVKSTASRRAKHPKCNTSAASGHHYVNTTVDLDALAGMYMNPGYGTFTLCGPSSPSSYCTQVRSEFAIVDQSSGGVDAGLVAAWPRIWTSHVRMRGCDGFGSPTIPNEEVNAMFDVYFTSLFPRGSGRDATPFEWGLSEAAYATAEFVVREGGEVGGFWMREVGEAGKVWFERVSESG